MNLMTLIISKPNLVCTCIEMLVNVQNERGNYRWVRILLVGECILYVIFLE